MNPPPPSPYPPFLGSENKPPPPDQALFHVIPVPYEKTVSYGKGTELGPAAILDASRYLEVYDGQGVPAERGIYTHPPVPCDGPSETVLERIGQRVATVRRWQQVPVVLGGEHTITFGAVHALRQEGAVFGVVQFDAHADLRETYQGTRWSHGCAARRVVDLGLPLFQVGVRSLSPVEAAWRTERGIPHLDADAAAATDGRTFTLPAGFPEQVYLTIDVDALDPSIIPATGTPEPGGLAWYTLINILDRIIAGRRVVGMDFVELAPIDGFPAPDFAVARLIYNVMGMISRSQAYGKEAS